MHTALLGYAWLSDVAAKRSARLTLWILVVGTLATLLNPYLAGAWLYAATIGVNPVIAGQVSEWQRTSPFAMPGLLFYPSVVVTVGLMVRRRELVRWPDWVLVASMALMGTWAVRGVAWWAFVMVFLLAGVLVGERPVRAPRASAVNGIIAIALGVAIVAALPWWRPADPLTGRTGLLSYAPSGLAAKLAELAGTDAWVVVPQTWGSWFEWAAPDQAYFIDSRFELFPPGVWADYAALQGPDAGDVLDRWAADVVVFPSGEAKPPGAWVSAWEDMDGAILVRAR